MPWSRPAWIVLVVGAAFAVLAVTSSAHADTILLNDASIITGEVQGNELSVMTPAGATTLGLRDLREVTLGTIGGDRVQDSRGRTVTGNVEQPAYAIRLASGQTVTVPRTAVAVIRLRPR
jgi:hypothetical protein